ncbi:MAG: toprim domain-containing protein [Nitrospirae bacterium]|nr:toprim domain-containing protein [Nitrospirota bacterium]
MQEASPDERERLLNWLNKLTDESGDVSPGDPVDRYLRNRGITLPEWPQDLRFHSRLPYREDGALLGHYPAMLAVVRDSGGHPVGFHRTYLTSDGQKASVPIPKKLTPLLGPSNAIQLAPHGAVLAVAEGVETAFSFGILSGLPVWSILSSGGIERFCPPAGVKKIVIGADHDKPGIKAAQVLVDRLSGQNVEVKAIFPDISGQDWNDVLREVSHA